MMPPDVRLHPRAGSPSRSAWRVCWRPPSSSRWRRARRGRPPPRRLRPTSRSWTRYCLSCHDDDKKRAGLSFEKVLDHDVAQHPEVWEKVVRKLRARQMPPAGRTRPDERDLRRGRLASLEASLDRAAAARPNPGRTDDVPAAEPHRVPERHPRPAGARHRRDGAAAGGRVQPRLRQRDGRRPLADAAGPLHHGGAEDQPAGGRQRRAGRPAATRSASAPDLTQEEHVEGCPLGTRGGALIRYTFPQDGEYEIQIRLTRDRNEHVEGLQRAARAGGAAGPRARGSRSR